MKDIRAKILSNKKIRHTYYKMVLDAPYIARTAKPGQFVQIKCSDSLEPFLRRPFSIHRVNGNIEILYETVGKSTEILSRKKEGDFLYILGPLGNGFSLTYDSHPSETRGSKLNLEPRAIIIAGGVGVAPLVYLAEELAKKHIKTIVLIGAKTKDLILCEKDFKKTAHEVYVSTDDGTYGSQGFVSKLFHKILKTVESRFDTVVYVCGPQGMLRCIAEICQERNFECQVSLEEKMACGIGVCLGCVVKTKTGNKLACKDGPVFDSSELLW
ncbi:MAG: dihydroorotate dehydrogenase electron transfer subunit [Candidatus Omnitrophica bacterium]|nr:dihydroorotate dehydrogenase electron transfer subunit [Candidatus Omnitrophota bacterium]